MIASIFRAAFTLSFCIAVSAATFAQAPDLIVVKKTFALPSYTTAAGSTIKDVKIGWEAAGRLNADKSNAILITHFFSGTSHAFGKYAAGDAAAGYWELDHWPGESDRHRQILRPGVRYAGQSESQGAQCHHHGTGKHQSRYRQTLRHEFPGGVDQGFRQCAESAGR